MVFRSILVVVAFLLLAAHFLRDHHLVVVVLCLLAPLVLLIRKPWARPIVQWSLYAGGIVWLHTTLVLTHARFATDQPWLRMAMILGAVTLLTFAAGALLGSDRVKQRYS